MSQKSGLRKQKKVLALQWVDEGFDVPIQASPLARYRPLQAPRALVLLDTTHFVRRPRAAS